MMNENVYQITELNEAPGIINGRNQFTLNQNKRQTTAYLRLRKDYSHPLHESSVLSVRRQKFQLVYYISN